MMNASADYIRGLKDGLQMYAWWTDGEQHVGTCGTTLKQALARIDEEYSVKATDAPSAQDEALIKALDEYARGYCLCDRNIHYKENGKSRCICNAAIDRIKELQERIAK